MDKVTSYPKLERSFKRKWLKALRSGKYKGATGTLCKIKKDNSAKGFCCLGVAGHIQGIPISQLKGNDFLSGKATKNFASFIPKELRGRNTLTKKLASMNDGKQGFKRIANWIQKNL